MTRAIVLAVLGLAGAGLAAAHDFWLVPVGDEIEGRTGSAFPISTNAVSPARLAEAVAVSQAGRRSLEVLGAMRRWCSGRTRRSPACSGQP